MATVLAPSVAPAPGRFSTSTGPSRDDICCATRRAIASTEPPAGNGTISLIGRSGKFCAVAGVALPSPHSAAATRIIRRVIFMRGTRLKLYAEPAVARYSQRIEDNSTCLLYTSDA